MEIVGAAEGAPTMSDEIVIGLGGNVGGQDAVLARFQRVFHALVSWGMPRASRVYRTAPVGPPQPDFLNAAIAVRPDLAPTPEELAAFVFGTERLLGRDRASEERWGPRTIDLDVLLWGSQYGRWQVAADAVLEVPHPRLATRRFALQPLADLVGDETVIPGAGARIKDLLRGVADQVVTETDLAIDRTTA